MTVKSIIVDLPLHRLAELYLSQQQFNGVFGGSGPSSGMSLIVHADDAQKVLNSDGDIDSVPAVLTITYTNDKPDDMVIKFVNSMFPGTLDRLLA